MALHDFDCSLSDVGEDSPRLRLWTKGLGRWSIKESELPAGDRIIDRIERYLASKGIPVRPSGGFNHYLVAAQFASKPPASLDADTMGRFEALFKALNALYD
jgi:hypothetical protein